MNSKIKEKEKLIISIKIRHNNCKSRKKDATFRDCIELIERLDNLAELANWDKIDMVFLATMDTLYNYADKIHDPYTNEKDRATYLKKLEEELPIIEHHYARLLEGLGKKV